jgi:hypothetical protein
VRAGGFSIFYGGSKTPVVPIRLPEAAQGAHFGPLLRTRGGPTLRGVSSRPSKVRVEGVLARNRATGAFLDFLAIFENGFPPRVEKSQSPHFFEIFPKSPETTEAVSFERVQTKNSEIGSFPEFFFFFRLDFV